MENAKPASVKADEAKNLSGVVEANLLDFTQHINKIFRKCGYK